jgi:hypothetical protein
MLPIQQFFIERLSAYRLTKTELAKALSSSKCNDGHQSLNDFFKCNEPDYETAKKIAVVLCMTDEEFEDLWYQTKDQSVRRKIKARIHNKKALAEERKVA